jgi:putative ABC transport system permease protein
MRSLISHLRQTIRLLAKSPGFTITAILILGLGIGANTAIFSLINGALLKPLPYPHPERLFQLFQPFQGFNNVDFNYADYLDYSANQHSFGGLTVFRRDDFNVSGRGIPERISGLYVSGPFFRLLGRPFVIGRPFDESEAKPDAAPVVVIGEHLWRTRFHSDPGLIGSNLSLNGRSFQVIGVTPAQGDEAAKVDLYVPLSQNPYFGTLVMTARGSHSFSCIGRLKESVSLREAQADLEVIRRNLAARYPDTNKAFGIRLVPYLNSVMNDYSTTLWLLGVAVSCLLLIACANVANLLLARARERRKEISIRAALGASRPRLMFQLLRESAVLAVAGAILGSLLAVLALDAIRHLAPEDIARFQEVHLDGGALVFVLVITLLTALFSGLFPSWANSKINLTSALRQEGDRGGTAGRERNRAQAFLVGSQVALTSVLLIGAGLLTRSFQALQSVPLGFNPDHVMTADIYLADRKYANQADCQTFFDALLTKVRRLPGIASASFDSSLPFSGNSNYTGFGIVGEPDPELNQVPLLGQEYVSPEYFKTVGIPLLKGRFFSAQDSGEKEKVVIVSESLARRYFPGQDSIGKQIHDFFDLAGLKRNFYTIIGVVGDIQHQNPEAQQSPFEAYYPPEQNPVPEMGINGGTLVIRTGNDPRSLTGPLSKLIADMDPNLPIYNVGLFDDRVSKSFATKRLATTIVSLFSGAALLLAAVGLYGVLSYSVTRRKREIGVRMALGAQSRSILRLVVRQGFAVVSIGIVIGLGTTLVFSRLIAGILYGVSATDLLSICLSVLILCFVALIACVLPGLRATRIDPITALRE